MESLNDLDSIFDQFPFVQEGDQVNCLHPIIITASIIIEQLVGE